MPPGKVYWQRRIKIIQNKIDKPDETFNLINVWRAVLYIELARIHQYIFNDVTKSLEYHEKSIKVSTFKTLLSDQAAFNSIYYWDGTNWQTMSDNSLINPGNAYFVKMNYAATLQYSEPELVHEGPPLP